jgi:hypothetical protein
MLVFCVDSSITVLHSPIIFSQAILRRSASAESPAASHNPPLEPARKSPNQSISIKGSSFKRGYHNHAAITARPQHAPNVGVSREKERQLRQKSKYLRNNRDEQRWMSTLLA